LALADRIQQAVGGTLREKRIALLGIAFKAETDDIRDAAALTVIPELQKRGASVAAFDPVAMDNGRQAFESVQWCADAYSAAIGADAVVILTEWNVFRGLDLRRMAGDMRQPVLVDFRNLFPIADARNSGMVYHSIGRASVVPSGGPEADVIPFKSGTV
jgi:UDPglucose 6-dehydrogenase